MAVFSVPLVLSNNPAAPTAVLESLLLSVSAPPVLKLPVLLLKSAYQPTAEFPEPVLRRLSALHPCAVVKLEPPSGGGLVWPFASGKSAKARKREYNEQQSEPAERRVHRMFNGRVAVFITAILPFFVSTAQQQRDM
jgi:hypothetical protein